MRRSTADYSLGTWALFVSMLTIGTCIDRLERRLSLNDRPVPLLLRFRPSSFPFFVSTNHRYRQAGTRISLPYLDQRLLGRLTMGKQSLILIRPLTSSLVFSGLYPGAYKSPRHDQDQACILHLPCPYLHACNTYRSRYQVAKNATSLGADPRSAGFIIGGGSAGGSITAVLAHLARDEQLDPPLTGQYLCVPAITCLRKQPVALRELLFYLFMSL